MLAAEHRMRRRADFAAALRGRRAGSGCVVVAARAAAPGTPNASDVPTAAPIVGLVVNRAVGGAVTRNLVRRRLRHALAAHVPGLDPGSRVVIRALPAAAVASYDQLARDLDSSLTRALGPDGSSTSRARSPR